jgi:hypothetical protein
MPWPQDPPVVQESTIVDTGLGTWWREDPFIWAGFAVIAGIVLVAILARDPNSGWRSKRIAAAARKSAAQFRRTSTSP